MKNKTLFFVFGILQIATLGLIVYFLLGTTSIGEDTRILLSILFPVTTFNIEYMIYARGKNE